MEIKQLNATLIKHLTQVDRKENESYHQCVSRLLNIYKECLSNFDYSKYSLNESVICQEIDEICAIVSNCIEEYNKADLSEAILQMTNMVNKYSSKLTSLTIDNTNEEYKNWYKIRPQEDTVRLYQAHEMFHIPFEKRYKVANQRFSISGLPCLYLGKSVWGCWEEMQETDFRFACVSRFEVQKQMTLLNVCLPDISKDIIDKQQICNLLRTWPLIISCSIKVLKPKEPFKPEYIIPQLLMLVINRNEGYMGCAYTSTQSNAYFDWDQHLLTNIAIPVRNVKEKGLCPTLCQYFKVTDSGKEEYFRLKGEIDNKKQEDAGLIYRPEKRCIELPVHEKGYKSSPFYFVEYMLNQLKAKQLSN